MKALHTGCDIARWSRQNDLVEDLYMKALHTGCDIARWSRQNDLVEDM